ncbi:MAG: tetratricopeptide repeat protein [Bacteroidota bacterium]|nr:tetratricopeptide repeat protein [Bacteroidota bacterium]
MKKFIIYGMLIITVASLALMGFQCSSAEMTSAKLYIQRKEYQNAVTQLQKELAKNPKNEEAWFLLGQIRIETKDYKGMKDAFVSALGVAPTHKKEITGYTVSIWGKTYNDGVEKLNKGDSVGYESAIEAFKLASYLEPDSFVNQQNLGLAYYKKGDIESAVGPLTEAMEKGKSLFAIKILSGMYLMHGTDFQTKFVEQNREAMETKKSLDQIREKTKAVDVKFYLGEPTSVTKESKGKGKNASAKEIWTYPKYNLVVTMANDVVESVKYTTAVAVKIDSAYHAKSVAEFDKAVDVLKKGSAMYPEDADLSESLMNAYIGAERNNEARDLLIARVKKYPDSKFDRYNYGVFLLKDNMYEEAVNEFKAALAIDPGMSSAVYNVAATYVNWGVAEQDRLKKAGKDDDKSYQEKYKAAIPFLEKVLVEKPNEVQIWELLGQVYANLGDPKKATEAYNKADAIRQGKN